jgi:hypothetical protein
MTWSSPDASIAKALLRVMRRPHDVIDHVSETIEMLGRQELRRRVTLRLRPDAFGSGSRWTYVDLLQPDKGALADLQVVDSNGEATVASHAEHQNVSSMIIRRRLLSVWDSAIVPRGQAVAFDNAMSAAYGALTRLPFQGEQEAVASIDKHFHRRSGLLKAALLPGVVLSARKMNYLFQLCTRLEKRYLLLVKLRLEEGRAAWVTFTHHSDVSEYNVRSKDFQRARPSPRHLRYASPPSSIRVHVPWAKRAGHYLLKLDAPEEYFLARQVLLLARRRRGEPQQMHLVPPTSRLRWSINSSRGRRSSIFLADAQHEPLAIFAGIQALEIPGRSTSRALFLAWFTTGILLGLAAFALFATGPIWETASLVVAFVAVGSFIVTPSAGPGVLGYPMLSRFTPPTLAFICVLFILWLATLSTAPTTEARAAASTELVLAWHLLKTLGGWVLGVASGALMTRILVRRRALIRHFRRATAQTTVMSANFF